MPSSFPNPGFPFNLVPIFIGGVFLLVFGTIALAIVSSLMQWMSGNAAPIETFEARVIAKPLRCALFHDKSSTRCCKYFHCVIESGIMDVFVGLCVPKPETQKIFEVIEL